jgi:hypothetical protein
MPFQTLFRNALVKTSKQGRTNSHLVSLLFVYIPEDIVQVLKFWNPRGDKKYSVLVVLCILQHREHPNESKYFGVEGRTE